MLTLSTTVHAKSQNEAKSTAQAATTDNEKEVCTNLKYFFNDATLKRTKIAKPGKKGISMCPELDKTCCTKQDFDGLAKYWQT